MAETRENSIPRHVDTAIPDVFLKRGKETAAHGGTPHA
jgi:hypothetical protein